jgi:hypothetical protein
VLTAPLTFEAKAGIIGLQPEVELKNVFHYAAQRKTKEGAAR